VNPNIANEIVQGDDQVQERKLSPQDIKLWEDISKTVEVFD